MQDSMAALVGMARGNGFAGLADKVVFITGAASGLGRAMAHAFAACQSRLVLFDMDAEGMERVRAELEAANPGVGIQCRQGLVNDEAAVDQVFAETEQAWGHVDVLLNNAGISMNCPTLELPGDQWRKAMDVNLNGVFYCARAAGRLMTARGRGVIVNTSSMYGVVAAPNRAAYCASKAAVAMLTKSLAVEWGPLGVRVNAIAPGYVRTALVDDLVARGRMDLDALSRRTPLGRLGTPEEIAALVLFLASDNAAFINGHVAVADGGWSAYGYI
ncbi:SDR family NAD(P)-dependent oxidoreductase [Castellaniella sp.]|uniref:SDR family NAD(P)-dependent oxidoreductase n=1 Tax=Castellaniella sp. TaxID=1955812 RepID=UPI0025BB03D2|nr:SDR family oxidoreductase [Castellaniella sp.]